MELIVVYHQPKPFDTGKHQRLKLKFLDMGDKVGIVAKVRMDSGLYMYPSDDPFDLFGDFGMY